MILLKRPQVQLAIIKGAGGCQAVYICGAAPVCAVAQAARLVLIGLDNADFPSIPVSLKHSKTVVHAGRQQQVWVGWVPLGPPHPSASVNLHGGSMGAKGWLENVQLSA